jgi:predicted small lipoprotein YifL
MRKIFAVPAILAALSVLPACDQAQAVYPDKDKRDTAPRMENEKRETIFGPEGLFGKSKPEGEGAGAGIGVNAFLWRATLDTISFMPITTADAFGGTVITDWYQLPETPNERFKVNVFILDRTLRADGVKVSLFKQIRDSSGNWADVRVDPRMGAELENSILTRARQLRIVSTE